MRTVNARTFGMGVVAGLVGAGLLWAPGTRGMVETPALAQGPQAAPPAREAGAAARLAAAEKVCQILHDRDDGRPTGHQGIEHTYLWSLRRMEAQRDVELETAGGGDRGVAAAAAHLARMREFSERIEQAFKAGGFSTFEVASGRYYVAEAEELLARGR